jgi:hypothetical protein
MNFLTQFFEGARAAGKAEAESHRVMPEASYRGAFPTRGFNPWLPDAGQAGRQIFALNASLHEFLNAIL